MRFLVDLDGLAVSIDTATSNRYRMWGRQPNQPGQTPLHCFTGVSQCTINVHHEPW